MSRKNRVEVDAITEEVETDMNTTIDENVEAEVNEALQKKDADKEAKKEVRNEAKKFVHEFMKAELDTDANLYKALKLLIGDGTRRAGNRVARASVNAALRQEFLDNDVLSEMDIFKKFHIGRPEMVTKIRIFILEKNPEDRIWIKFYPDTEEYKLEGTGVESPANWDGYLPADTKIL